VVLIELIKLFAFDQAFYRKAAKNLLFVGPALLLVAGTNFLDVRALN